MYAESITIANKVGTCSRLQRFGSESRLHWVAVLGEQW